MLVRTRRGQVTAATTVAVLVLIADALVAMLMALPLSVSLLFLAVDEEPAATEVLFAVIGLLAAIALLCPAMATLVAGVRTRAAHLAGCVVTALIAVAAAGLTAMALRYGFPSWFAPASIILFAANVLALFLLTGRLGPAAGTFPAAYDRRMAVFAQISLGVHDCERAGAFWSRALGYVRRAPRWEGDDWIVIEPPPGVAGPAIAMDLSETEPPEFPRIHFDLQAPDGDLATEVDRLVALGATRVDWPFYPEPGERHPDELPYVVLADPEGNRFCVAA
ncbi:hypothetical protein Ait01nite_014040 [Actinoplanes italicus]|uniref:VOC domain-containing protein n=1 Tax=Actinoplanes italicus TaxID=113567 RepID=A0A2T0KHX3_9ACTN|nr:VOC family protein [Actinoplanes italicus]PRX22837.1 hypothetical protein CLV67_104365 [Actinoplanes italicus]GIE28359.1 hypothetical protein Ait01nite_014040 [Actinoplanes italicus]